jgi:hypothetical protein
MPDEEIDEALASGTMTETKSTAPVRVIDETSAYWRVGLARSAERALASAFKSVETSDEGVSDLAATTSPRQSAPVVCIIICGFR